PNKGPNDVHVKYATVSAQDRARLLDCSRRGGDLPPLARTLGINIETARSIARTGIFQGRGEADVKEKRKVFAAWLERDGPQTLRFYVDETNFNIWCSRKFGQSQRGTEAAYMREQSEEILIRPDDITVKKHRWRLLQTATQDVMQNIHQSDCRAYDRHSFEFVTPALGGAQM
ncbi:hypothetical protein HPB47_005295, partial [Ixodes persulcatus]